MRKTQSDTETSGVAIPGPGEGKRGEQGYIGYLLRQAGAAYKLAFERALADLGVTQPQFLVLTMLKAYPGASNADIARLTMLTPQTVSVIVGNLKKAGAVSGRPHAVHGRIQHLDVTEEGAALLARCRRRTTAIEEQMVAGLSRQEEQIIRRWLVNVALVGERVGPDSA